LRPSSPSHAAQDSPTPTSPPDPHTRPPPPRLSPVVHAYRSPPLPDSGRTCIPGHQHKCNCGLRQVAAPRERTGESDVDEVAAGLALRTTRPPWSMPRPSRLACPPGGRRPALRIVVG